jgi:hypothetical protein
VEEENSFFNVYSVKKNLYIIHHVFKSQNNLFISDNSFKASSSGSDFERKAPESAYFLRINSNIQATWSINTSNSLVARITIASKTLLTTSNNDQVAENTNESG